MQDILTFLNQHQSIVSAILALLIVLVIIEFIRAKRLALQINTHRATHLINRENAVVIDIRDKELYKDGHIIDSLSMTKTELKNPPKRFDKYRTKPLIIVDQSGVDSQKVAADLFKHGYNVYSLAGGLRSWKEAQLPLIKE